MNRNHAHPRALLALAVVALLNSPAIAAPPIDDQTLDKLKGGTIFLRANFRTGTATGSGFVVAAEGRTIYIASNAHTVRLAGRTCPDVALVFHSGAPTEKTVKAEVVGFDEEQDLAVLRARMESPPDPLELAQPKLRQTQGVLVLGFPFGEALAAHEGNPEITVARGAIASIRRDAFDRVAWLQIDGAVNPGNSGGPVVDGAGRVLGIATATIPGTHIGLALPAARLEAMLEGTIGRIRIEQGETDADRATVSVEVALVDPMRRIQRVKVRLAPAERFEQAPEPGPNGDWKPIGGAAVEAELEIGKGKASGQLRLPSPERRSEYLAQVSIVDGDGRTTHAAPSSVFISPPLVGRGAGGDEPDDGGWLGATNVEEQAERPTGEPYDRHETLGGATRTMDGATVVPLKINAERVLANMIWSSDAGHALIVEDTGYVRKVKAPGLICVRELRLPREIDGVTASKAGLALTVRANGELWVIDDSDLTVRRKVRIPRLLAASGARGSKFVVCVRAGQGGALPHELAVVDASNGRIVREYDWAKLQPEPEGPKRYPERRLAAYAVQIMRMSPDGDALYIVSDKRLLRFSLQGNRLRYADQVDDPRMKNPQRIEVSHDSSYVAMIAGSGNRPRAHRYYRTDIYASGDFDKPALVLNNGAYPRVLAFDKPARRIYGSNTEATLVSFSPDGEIAETYELGSRRERVRQILVHPAGRRALVLSNKQLMWVELPK